MGSQPGGSTHSPVGHWAAVFVIIIGACALSAGIILGQLWLAIGGAAVAAIAALYAAVTGIMNTVEEYPAGRQDVGA